MGDLEVITGKSGEDLLHRTHPLIRAGKTYWKILVAPIRRYVIAKCCENAGHVPNFRRPGYQSSMLDALCTASTATGGF